MHSFQIRGGGGPSPRLPEDRGRGGSGDFKQCEKQRREATHLPLSELGGVAGHQGRGKNLSGPSASSSSPAATVKTTKPVRCTRRATDRATTMVKGRSRDLTTGIGSTKDAARSSQCLRARLWLGGPAWSGQKWSMYRTEHENAPLSPSGTCRNHPF